MHIIPFQSHSPHPRCRGNSLETPITKNYDAIPGHRPSDWPQSFNLSEWRFAAALLEDVRVGRELLRWAENEAVSAERSRLLVETQDINTAACEFYSANRYIWVLVDPLGYPELPNEARVVWAKSFL